MKEKNSVSDSFVGFRSSFAIVRGLRIVSRVSFILFFAALLFYVCCPYPTETPQTFSGWIPLEIDVVNGTVVLQVEDIPERFDNDREFWLVDAELDPPFVFGRFAIEDVDREGQTVALKTLSPLSEEASDALSTTFDDLSICEQDPNSFPDQYLRRYHVKSDRLGPAHALLSCDLNVGLAALSNGSGVSIAIVCVVFLLTLALGRVFCGWICPLGAFFDLFDLCLTPLRNLLSRKTTVQIETPGARAFYQTRWFLWTFFLGASGAGLAIVGWLAPIPMLTRNSVFLIGPFQTAYFRSWGQVPELTTGAIVSLTLAFLIAAFGLFGRRVFCRIICPTGAFITVLSVLRIFRLRVDRERCVGCRRCVKTCSFDAVFVKGALASINANCVACADCVADCPTNAITFGMVKGVRRPKLAASELESVSCTKESSSKESIASRRSFGVSLGLATAGIAGCLSGRALAAHDAHVVRPPGALSEEEFLRVCVRCGACLRACPNDALQPLDLHSGLARLWTPGLAADHSGCEPSCANCGQVCPTGAIQRLTIEEKRRFVIGLASVDATRCLPLKKEEDCRLCYDECSRAGYYAIEFISFGAELDENGRPIEGTGFLAPNVIEDRCLGCGLCQARCAAINVRSKKTLDSSAIVVLPIEKKREL